MEGFSHGQRAFLSIVVAAAFGLAEARGEVYHVAPHGSDEASGDLTHPFRTIQRGADAAQPGDTVLVAPGIYRERVAAPRGGTADQPIVFRSQKRHAAIIKGSDIWEPAWESHGDSVWSGILPYDAFTDTAHLDGANPFAIPLASTPWSREGFPEYERHRLGQRGGNPDADPRIVYSLGQVFVDSLLYRQVPLRPELDAAPGSWFYDANERRLYVHFASGGPGGHIVEITTRRRIFAPHQRGLGYLEIDGFVMEHCGNQYPTDFWLRKSPQWQQAGAVGTRGGHHWRIHHNWIRLAQGIGLDLGLEGHAETDLESGNHRRPDSAGHHIVDDNIFSHNGGGGTAGYDASRLVLRRNIIVGNNLLRFYGKKRWESAGIKLHTPHKSLLEHNVLVGNHACAGLWLDQGAGHDTQIRANVIVGHAKGIDVEIGRTSDSVAAHNILIDNTVGIAFREAGGMTVANNLIVAADGTGIHNTIDRTRLENWTSGPIGVFGNIIAGERLIAVVPPNPPRIEARRFDGNIYGANAGDEKWAVAGAGSLCFSDWQKLWQDSNNGSDWDGGSVRSAGLRLTLDRQAGTLTVQAGIDPTRVQRQVDPLLGADFTGQLPTAGQGSIPGPFQRLTAGEFSIQLWAADSPVNAGSPWAVPPPP
jgi:hypothetical protein